MSDTQKIYTRSGDDGTTALADGERVAKGHDRIEAYGTVEELNACIGVALEHLRQAPPAVMYRVAPCLTRVQNELFDLCSELATPPRIYVDGMPATAQPQIDTMERMMDKCNQDLPPLKSFMLPGGGLVSANLHVCRTVSRRAEREVLRLAQKEAVRPEALKYLNRLSDLLFVLARWAQLQAGEPEVTWEPQGTLKPTTPVGAPLSTVALVDGEEEQLA